MVQIIGIMIGAYIFTRMLETATNANVNAGVQVIAVLTVLVDLACLFLLVTTSIRMPAGM